MSALATLVDRALEASVVGSFSKVGYDARSRLGHWSAPAALPGAEVMVTGGTSGLGFEACVQFARMGASVTFVARSPDRARTARALIAELSGSDDVAYVLADVSDLASIRRAAADYLRHHDTLDVLVHNAGTLERGYEQTPEGTERTVATHVVGPFLLTGLLLDALRHPRAGRDGPARVLSVSSGGMYTQRFDLERLEGGPDGFDGVSAYARAKRAQVVLTHEWAARVDPREVVFHAVHPGWADTPGVRTSLPGFARVADRLLRTPYQGVDTLLWLARAPQAARCSGRFWLDRQPRTEHKVPWTRAADPTGEQARLWAWCAARTGWDAADRTTCGTTARTGNGQRRSAR